MTATITLTLDRLDQLIDDPAPFGPPHLTDAAASFLAARAAADGTPPTIDIALPHSTNPQADAALIVTALRGHADRVDAALSAQAVEARRTMLIGLGVVAVTLTVAALPLFGREMRALTLIQESLVILGWVGLWRPADTYLYDLPAQRRHRNVWRRLAAATVTVRAAQGTVGAVV